MVSLLPELVRIGLLVLGPAQGGTRLTVLLLFLHQASNKNNSLDSLPALVASADSIDERRRVPIILIYLNPSNFLDPKHRVLSTRGLCIHVYKYILSKTK